MEEVKKKELFWVEKIEKALDTITREDESKVEIVNNELCIHLSKPNNSVQLWIKPNGIEIIPLFESNVSLTLGEDDMEALLYLFRMKDAQTFLWVIGRWIEKREKAKQSNQFGIISERLKQDTKEISEILKRWEKLLNNLPN